MNLPHPWLARAGEGVEGQRGCRCFGQRKNLFQASHTRTAVSNTPMTRQPQPSGLSCVGDSSAGFSAFGAGFGFGRAARLTSFRIFALKPFGSGMSEAGRFRWSLAESLMGSAPVQW